MDFTLTFKDSQEKGYPDHNSKISYYVLEKNFYLDQELHPQYDEVHYGWLSACQEVYEHYNPETDSDYHLGDSRPSTHFSEDENESHRTVHLCIYLNGYYHRLTNNPAIPRIAWRYTHDLQRLLSAYQGKNYFPCFDINNLLREGVVKPIGYEKVEVGAQGNSYYHIYGIFEYQEQRYYLKMAQDSKWEDSDWTESGGYGKVDVFEWRKL